jgi:hypothetical protein
VGLLAAKERTVRRIQTLHPEWDEGTIKGKLIAYSSGTWPELSNTVGYKRLDLVKSEALTAVTMKIKVFWDVSPCSLVKVYRRFGGTHIL